MIQCELVCASSILLVWIICLKAFLIKTKKDLIKIKVSVKARYNWYDRIQTYFKAYGNNLHVITKCCYSKQPKWQVFASNLAFLHHCTPCCTILLVLIWLTLPCHKLFSDWLDTLPVQFLLHPLFNICCQYQQMFLYVKQNDLQMLNYR